MEFEFKHIPIMLNECIEGLAIKEDGVYVDATLGGGGHSYEIVKRLSEKGRLIGIDRDAEALSAAKKRLSGAAAAIDYVHSNYSEIKNILNLLRISGVDGILADLGVSSYQLDNPERGFSFRSDAPLDMRMNREDKLSAYDVVNGYELERLYKIIKDYGEERHAFKIASNIVKAREKKTIETTLELAGIVVRSIPKKGAPQDAARTFQAIRIEVNSELSLLKKSAEDFLDVLNPGGRLAVITFHSLEDRIIKNVFRDYCAGCICPKELPVCVCNNKPKGRLVNNKPLRAAPEEVRANSRSACAKLRIIEKF